MTTSPGSAAPLRTRSTPTPSTTRTPRLGRLSRSGSNAARMRPARMPSSRSSRAFAAKRSVSWLSRPSVLTTMAPSKDSWAISLSSARRAWMRVKIGEDSRWKTTLTTITSGKTSRPTLAMARSVNSICAIAMTIIARVPTAIGSGAIGAHAASTSELALESSSPVGWRWCHDIGRVRYWRVTSRR